MPCRRAFYWRSPPAIIDPPGTRRLLLRNETVSGTLSVHTPGRYRLQVRVAPRSDSEAVPVYQEFTVGL